MSKALVKVPITRTMTRNIVRVFLSATPEEIADGMGWYERALTEAMSLAESQPGGQYLVGEDWEYAVEQAAAVLAVLSPRLSWPKNVELARLAYDRWANLQDHTLTEDNLATLTFSWPGLKANAAKAFRILAGETPDDVVSGPKVRAFWHTIVNPSDPRAVVVDRHAFDVAVNKVMTDETRGRFLGLKGTYDLVSKAYADAAREINKLGIAGRHVTPAGVQAVTWTIWRRTRAAAFHGDV
jgi:hypothetical protein